MELQSESFVHRPPRHAAGREANNAPPATTESVRALDRVGRGRLMMGVLCWAAFLVGCTNTSSKPSDSEGVHLRPLAIAYGRYLGSHRGRPPANQRELLDFIQKSAPEVLARFQVTNPASLFTSPRDQQPYVVQYGGQRAPRLVAYEQTGVNGKRWTVDQTGIMTEMDDSEFRAAVSRQP